MSLKSEMICMICKLFLHKPVSFPYHCLLCNEHLHDDTAKNGSIRCTKCLRDFELRENEFAPSYLASYILEKELHLSDEEKAFKKSIHDLVHQLEQLQIEFQPKYTEWERNNFDHFSEIRRKIDIHREELKAQIDKIALKMIDQLNEKETECKLELSKLHSKITDTNIRQKNQALLKELRNPNKILNDFKSHLTEREAKIMEIQNKLVEFDNAVKNIKSFDFSASHENYTFGILKMNTLPKKKRLVTCSQDRTIRISDLESNRCIRSLDEHADQVFCLEKISENVFASGSFDKTIKIWDVNTNNCIRTLSGHQHGVTSLTGLSSKTIASGSHTEIKIWNIDDGTCIQTLTGHTDWVRCIVRMPNGNLISCSDDSTIKMWDLAQSVCAKMLNMHANYLFLLPNGHLASGSDEGKIHIWNLDNFECVKILIGHGASVWRINMLESGELVSCSYDKTIKIWDVDRNICVRTLTGHTGLVRSFKISQNNNVLVSCSENGVAKIWNLETWSCANSFEMHGKKAIYDLLLI